MSQHGIVKWLKWALFATALYLIYHLVVRVAFIDLSWIALLLFIPLLGLSYFLIRPDERKQVIVFTIGFLMLDRSLTRLDAGSLVTVLVGGFIAVLVIAVLAKWYGKLTWNAVLALVLVAVVGNAAFNKDNLAVLNHFKISWESDKLYSGSWVDYFPITLYDVDQDGKQEIITYGNVEEVPEEPKAEKTPETEAERKALADKLLHLKAEPLSLYIYTWKNGQMVRIPNEQVTPDALAQVKERLPVDLPGFPYYTEKNNQLVPNVQRQSYAESIMQFGTAPYHAFLLDMMNIDELLKQNQGRMDQRTLFTEGSKFRDITIEAGQLSGMYDGKAFSAPTQATKLVNIMKLSDGREGLLVLGEHLGILAVEPDGSVKEIHSLSRKQVELTTAEFILADLDHDGGDEVLVAGTPSYILKAQPDGQWQILWVSAENDKSFRFSNYATVGHSSEPEIIAKVKSWVSTTYQLRYLSGFHYTPRGLEQTWKAYLPLINVQIGDVDGDNENEIVASIYDTHRVLVLKQHDIPVLPIAIALFIGLIGYGFVRRFRHV